VRGLAGEVKDGAQLVVGGRRDAKSFGVGVDPLTGVHRAPERTRSAPLYVTIEAVLPLHGDRAAIVNDTNFGSTGRNPGLPDYSDFIVVTVPGLRAGGHW
jgi:hypothetical protein